MERAAMAIIWLLALACSTVPAALVAMAATSDNPQHEFVTAGGAYTSDLYLLLLAWWLPFALPVILIGLMFVRAARKSSD